MTEAQASLFLEEPLGSPYWQPTRAAGRARLQAFVPFAGRAYGGTRNHDRGLGAHGNVSGLSPWVRRRLVSEEEVLAAVLGRHSRSAAEKFVQEVFWRTYFKGWLEQRPAVWARYRTALAEHSKRLERDADLARRYDEAVTARTGIACFDAWIRELTETGYLHNHARMWTASIWIFTLRLPWELGADLFLRHLLDGDPASNTLSWRWVGGLHTRGKTYLARASNISKYTGGRYGPTYGLATVAEPLDEPPLPDRIAPPSGDPLPEVGARWGLLLTEEDCDATWLPGGPQCALGFTAPAEPGVQAERACAFAAGAVDDGLSRLDCPTARRRTGDWTGTLTDWAKTERLDCIVTPYAPVGPVADRLAAAEPELAANGVRLMRALRPFDRSAWPHANAGYFKLKKRIPRLLDELGL